MNKIEKIILIILFFIPLFGFAKVDIRIAFDNQQDSVFYFCKYRGSKAIIIDTLILENGIIRYKNNQDLPEGIYLLTNDKNLPLIEVLVGKDQQFSLTINDLENLDSVKVKGAKETEIYYKMMAKIRRTDMNISALEYEKESNPDYEQQIDSLRTDLKSFEESLKIKKKDAFINLVLNSVKTHKMEDYWDDFQLYDKRILTYPLIDNKLETYFNNLPPDADIINAEIDNLIEKTGDCVEVRDYLIWYFYRKYYNPDHMNLDDIYIHLVDDYFLKLNMENVSESVINLMADRAQCLEHLKLGAQIPEIGNIYRIDSQFIALIFYDKTCKKCASEGRKLEEIRARHPEMMIFPVEINSGIKKNMLSEYDIQTTPMIYLLDNHKRIVAKRIKAEQVEFFLNKE